MQLNGIEIDFDFTDATDLERFEVEYEKLQSTDYTAERASETIRKQCLATKRFFDNVLGYGVYEQLVKRPFSGIDNTNAILDLVDAYTAAISALEQQQQQRFEKYKAYLPERRQSIQHTSHKPKNHRNRHNRRKP